MRQAYSEEALGVDLLDVDVGEDHHECAIRKDQAHGPPDVGVAEGGVEHLVTRVYVEIEDRVEDLETADRDTDGKLSREELRKEPRARGVS